jgi:hypothetical protein
MPVMAAILGLPYTLAIAPDSEEVSYMACSMTAKYQSALACFSAQNQHGILQLSFPKTRISYNP